jgi:hypothetical protein
MARTGKKVTSKSVATLASKQLSDAKQTKTQRRVAASDLSQREKPTGKKRKP